MESSPHTETVRIEKLVYGGEGLARLANGEVCFVPWSVPGDCAQVTRSPEVSKPVRANIQTLQEPSPERVEALCDVFETCGGCQWQHVSLPAQRHWKRAMVEESLSRIGKLRDLPILETRGDDAAAWHYRNRAQWEAAPNGSKGFSFGYYVGGSHQIVPFSKCHIVTPALNALADVFRRALATPPKALKHAFRVEAVLNTEASQGWLLFESASPDGLAELSQKIKAQFPALLGAAYRSTAKKFAPIQTLWGNCVLTLPLGGQDFYVSAGSFFQVNLASATHILQCLTEWVPPNTDSLIDLYAGVGVFALHLQDRVNRLVAIESAASAASDARANLRRHQAQRIDFRTGDVRRILPTLKESFETAIVDPPRAGCDPEVLQWLSQHVTRQLLYVSCNPTTLARDLKRLTELGWQVQQVQPIDMFPQTYHVECVVNLIRAETPG